MPARMPRYRLIEREPLSCRPTDAETESVRGLECLPAFDFVAGRLAHAFTERKKQMMIDRTRNFYLLASVNTHGIPTLTGTIRCANGEYRHTESARFFL